MFVWLPLFPAAAKCTKLSANVGAMQAEAAKQIEGLKEGLVRELRKQKASMLAGLAPAFQ